MKRERYFHGGTPGLQVGDALLPPDLTGTAHRLAHYAPTDAPAYFTDGRWVYVTTNREVARGYAAFHPDGALYEVTPDGLEQDPDCYVPDLSFRCVSARIRTVVDPVVLFRTRSPERWLRALTGALRCVP